MFFKLSIFKIFFFAQELCFFPDARSFSVQKEDEKQAFAFFGLHCLLVYFRRAYMGKLRILDSSPTFGLHSPNPPGADFFLLRLCRSSQKHYKK